MPPNKGLHDDCLGFAMSGTLSSVVAYVEKHASLVPLQTALMVDGKPCTYSVLWGATCRFARTLRELGVERGARVLLHADHSPAFVAAYLGTTLCGAVAVPFEGDLPANTLEDLAHRVKAVCCWGCDMPGVARVPDGWMPVVAEMARPVAASLQPTWADDVPSAVDCAELLPAIDEAGSVDVIAVSHGEVMAADPISAATKSADGTVSVAGLPLGQELGLRQLQAGLVAGAIVVLKGDLRVG